MSDKDKALATKWIREPFGPFPVRLNEGPDEYLELWKELVIQRITSALATVRRESQANFVNNIAAVLDADDVEVFTALIMKARQSPDLESTTRSALKSEAEIRREAREEAFRDAIEIAKVELVPNAGVGSTDEDFNAATQDVITALDRAADSREGGNDG